MAIPTIAWILIIIATPVAVDFIDVAGDSPLHALELIGEKMRGLGPAEIATERFNEAAELATDKPQLAQSITTGALRALDLAVTEGRVTEAEAIQVINNARTRMPGKITVAMQQVQLTSQVLGTVSQQ